MTRDEVTAKVCEFIAENGPDAGEIDIGDKLTEDLDFDEIDVFKVVEVVVAAEDEYDIDITDEEVVKLVTVGDIITCICGKLGVPA